MKKQTKKNRIKQYTTSRNFKGGRFLGKGSFGCVISPALKCSKTRSISGHKVSKIIKSTGSDEEKNELYLSKILNKLDPQQKYFLSIIDYCPIKTIPSTRSNIARARLSYSYNNSSRSESGNSGKTYEVIDSKKLDKEYCPVDLSEHPLNIIMQDGGLDLFNLAEHYRNNKHNHTGLIKTDPVYITSYSLLTNFKKVFKHLIMGLKVMHDNNIVNRDIKEENIMAKYDTQKHKLLVRYIDFGMSEHITSSYARNEYNIKLSGSPDLIAPEIFITYYVYRYKNNPSKIVDNIRNSIDKYIIDMLKNLDIYSSRIAKEVNDLYLVIQKHLKQHTLQSKYFGMGRDGKQDTKNSYLQKSDIYSLGIAMYEFVYILTNNSLQIEKQTQLKDLLMNMIVIDPEKRFTVDQCLKHSYFTSS